MSRQNSRSSGILLGLITCAILGCPLIITTSLSASPNASTSLTQRILPMDCVFNEVNDGLGTLIFVTPTECGVVEPEIQQQLEQLSQNQSQQTQGNSGTTSLLLIRNQNPSSTNNQTPSSTPAPQSAASKDPIIPIVNDSASVPKASAVQPRQKHTPGWVMPTLIVTGLAVVGISLPVTAPQLMAGLRRYWYK